ncbi:MAG TPA: hypothetical protein VGU69_03605 [Rhizomicrobium sp.]|nr:hypothetical protein [Rhizomicrobium sp.]
MKLLTSILTTFGYGLLGTVTVQSLIQHNAVTWGSVAGGLVTLGLALYFAPEGEKS